MALPQQKQRELVFEILFSLEFHEQSDRELISFIMSEHKVTKKYAVAALEKAKKISEEKERLDSWIQKVSHSYAIDRIQTVERTILRLALFELFTEKLPLEVAISEAKRLSRKFTSHDAQAFIHALIDAVLKEEKGSIVP